MTKTVACRRFVRASRAAAAGTEAHLAADAATRAHLLDCADCRAVLRGAIGAGQALETLRDDGRFPTAFFADLERDILAAAGEAPRSRRIARRVGAAAAAAALFVAGLALTGMFDAPPRSVLVDAPGLAVVEPFVFDPSSLTMPVGENVFRGLRGRALLEEMLEWSGKRRRGELPPAGR